jgi:23S rRNA (cytidine1920-2'-O)/16S rRNA (cytidine1409-2'-O)-methyltransferase
LLPVLARLAVPEADLILLVKPQFEVGKDLVGRNGVVRDPALWMGALDAVVAEATTLGLGLINAVPSALPGPAGNREFFVHLRRAADTDMAALARAVEEVS